MRDQGQVRPKVKRRVKGFHIRSPRDRTIQGARRTETQPKCSYISVMDSAEGSSLKGQGRVTEILKREVTSTHAARNILLLKILNDDIVACCPAHDVWRH